MTGGGHLNGFMACGGSDGEIDLRYPDTDPSWCWWETIHGHLAQTRKEDRVGTFFPMTRLSHAMVDALRLEFGRSTGFCEVYFSTLCANTPGLVIAPIPGRLLGRFVYRPVMEEEQWNRLRLSDQASNGEPRFYHPVKPNLRRIVPKLRQRPPMKKVDADVKQQHSNEKSNRMTRSSVPLYEDITPPRLEDDSLERKENDSRDTDSSMFKERKMMFTIPNILARHRRLRPHPDEPPNRNVKVRYDGADILTDRCKRRYKQTFSTRKELVATEKRTRGRSINYCVDF